MQRLEVSGAVRVIYMSLGVKGLINVEEDENLEKEKWGKDVKRRMRRGKRRITKSRSGNTPKILRHVTDVSCGSCRNM